MTRRVAVGAVILLAACQSTELPEGQGEGVTAYDREPPENTQLYEPPTWQVGDRFVYLRAGQMKLPFRVKEVTDDTYVLEHEEGGSLTTVTHELAMSGMELPDQPDSKRVDDPPEALLHWPLWVGKRWSCSFVRKQAGRPALPLQSEYLCDGVEDVKVPAGTFRCLRIWRRVRVDAEGQFVQRTSLMWYAPGVGNFVRRLENGTLMELEAYHRQ